MAEYPPPRLLVTLPNLENFPFRDKRENWKAARAFLPSVLYHPLTYQSTCNKERRSVQK